MSGKKSIEINETEFYYYGERVNKTLYVSKQFLSYNKDKKMRFAHKKHESETQIQFKKVKGEIILSETIGGKHQFKAKLIEDDKRILELIIQNFNTETGFPRGDGFSFRGIEIENLYNFIKALKEIDYSNTQRFKVRDEDLGKIFQEQIQEDFTEIVELLKKSGKATEIVEALKGDVTHKDIISLAYRKSQLDKFYNLLSDEVFFEREREAKHQKTGKQVKDEKIWQDFFEENPWIFGYGLNYIFNTPLSGKKLEQVVSGYRVNSKGKRIDALMKTKGIINSFCFGEIKTHKTKLLGKQYRGESWAISDELAGAVAQVQKSIQKSLYEITEKTQMKDLEGNPTKEQIFMYQPKSFIIIGSLQQFVNENGVNDSKFSSFELFRRNHINPEIITFDELYERAKFIIRQNEDNE